MNLKTILLWSVVVAVPAVAIYKSKPTEMNPDIPSSVKLGQDTLMCFGGILYFADTKTPVYLESAKPLLTICEENPISVSGNDYNSFDAPE